MSNTDGRHAEQELEDNQRLLRTYSQAVALCAKNAGVHDGGSVRDLQHALVLMHRMETKLLEQQVTIAQLSAQVLKVDQSGNGKNLLTSIGAST